MIVSAGLLVAGCAAGNKETDREANTIAVAISHPRQNTAVGFANAALATSLGETPDFSVIEMRDVKAETLTDPLAHLVIRIHHEPAGPDWGDPVTACYNVEFNYYGIIGEPSRTTCPDNPASIKPPPLPRRFLDGSPDNAMDAVLTALRPIPSEAHIRDALRQALPRSTITPAHIPEINVTVDAERGTVAVSAITDDASQGLACLLGTRIDGVSVVWRLQRAERSNEDDPPEPWPCNPRHALQTQHKPR